MKFSGNVILKIFFLALGLADLVGVLPAFLNLPDKILASGILFYFWLSLSPTRFIIGKRDRKLDWLILITLYILVIDTFVPFAADLFVIDQATGLFISTFSITVGSILLIILAGYIVWNRKIETKSAIHAFLTTLDKKERLWHIVNKQRAFRFIILLLALFAFSQFLFGLVNQWLIVSLDKSLIIVAFIFAIKDLEKSKIKAFHTLGEFDDILLNKVIQLFTTSQFYLGVGFVLIFHYLSDLGTFFLPYLFNLGQDPYYFSRLGAEAMHLNLVEIFRAETFTSTFSMIAGSITYILSGLGILLLLLIPIALCFFIVFKFDVRRFAEKKYAHGLVALVCVSVITFILAPWTYQQAILPGTPQYLEASGILGVDFLTQTISATSVLGFAQLFFVVIILFSLIMAFRKSKDYLITFLSLGSLVFLGMFAWNYFHSSMQFYLANNGAIAFFLSQNNFFVAAILYLLFFIDMLFYIGGFVMFAYFTCRYLVQNVTDELLDNRLIIGWSFAMILISIALIAFTNQSNFAMMNVLLFSFLATGSIFNFALYQALQGKDEYRDDLILSIGIVVFVFLLFGILSFILETRLGIAEEWLNLVTPVLIAVISLFLVKSFKLPWNLRIMDTKKFLISAAMGVAFGFLFYFLNEPIVWLHDNIIAVVAATIFIAIAEENMFRMVVLKLAEKSYSFRVSQILQGLAFALIHFLFITSIFEHYADWTMFLTYFVALFIFAIAMGWLMGKGEKSNVMYPVVAHWITNIIAFSLLL